MWDNIQDGKEGNFRKCTSCDLQGLPYDIGSVMHYHAKAFAKDYSKETIVPLNGVGLRDIGQRNGFSDSDIEGINKLYCNNLIPGAYFDNFILNYKRIFDWILLARILLNDYYI